MKKVVEVFIVIILFIAIGFGGWYLYNSIQKERNRVNELENKLVNIETAGNLNTEEKNDKSNNIDNNKLNNVDNENKNQEKNIQEKIIGKWSIERIFDSVTGEEMGYSQFFGLEIAEKYHFEFYEDGTYIMQLGERDEKGTYKIMDNKINMTSNSKEKTNLEIENNNGNIKLVEKEEETGVQIDYVKE